MEFLTIKAWHIVAVVCWYAGLFYLPRIFIYHTENKDKTQATEIFETMERKLYKFIMMPAMILSWVFGLMLLHENPYLITDGFTFFHIKLTALIILTFYHFSLDIIRKQLLAGNFKYSSKFLRLYNEIPTILLFVIVFLVVIKPF